MAEKEAGTPEVSAHLHETRRSTRKLSSSDDQQSGQPAHSKIHINRYKAILLIVLLAIVVLQTGNTALSQLTGPQGWAYVLAGPSNNAPDQSLLNHITEQLHPTSHNGTGAARPTPQQYIDLIIHKMSLEQKLGQMMIVQFTGSSYSLPLSTMIGKYGVGAVLLFSANGNIISKTQFQGLIQQMKSHSAIPLAVAIDQEGGAVDRLAQLDGSRASAASIGATGDPAKAQQAGVQDAQDLSAYGINLNLAPVVDVTTVYNPQLASRTYGSDPTLVTQMAAAYLQGLQQSGRVIGTLKHFPGLGDVGVDPHTGVPHLTRSKDHLEQITWAPYRSLIQQKLVHAVMVTHEVVEAVDNTQPSTLSYKVVTGILRNELHFQGVIITDSLTMEGISAFHDEAQAGALAIEAGADLLMGATSPADVERLMDGIKQAIKDGSITQQRIDDSVRRILLLKYSMGLLPIPKN
ncbi:glycoside hydrolase family 3 protein [Ktedonosporobacter rubrisoli]|nr:glycoside hydrolase family 3 N-terminal domain-containing protein [Ktedonosporobacter rubrisoli]